MIRKEIVIAMIVLGLVGMACGLTAGLSGDNAGTGRPGPADMAPEAQSGERLFSERECKACHVAGAGVVAPPLAGLFGETVTLESGETVTVDEDYIRESILSPGEKIVLGYNPIMPDFEGEITEEELAALVEYIRSLKE
jgi:cytochrome c oxidase subunit II